MALELTSPSLQPTSRLRDLLALGKPHITVLSILTGAAGLWLAPAPPASGSAGLGLLLGLGLLVGAAHSLNQYLERDLDALMERTRDRPLPAGRLAPALALWVGLAAGGLALLLLGLLTNRVTTLLGALALVLYVLVYTPLKRRTPHALLIGAIPGAMPPLMGWTAAAGSIGLPGLTLFLLVALWQVPHFIAIALYRRDDYDRAGIRTIVSVHGPEVARRQSLLYSSWLLLAGLLLPLTGASGWAGFLVALAAGASMWISALRGVREQAGAAWARRFFRLSLVYLPALLLGLLFERVLG